MCKNEGQCFLIAGYSLVPLFTYGYLTGLTEYDFFTGTQADKVFTASGNEVKGYTRKGKVFLTIETSVSETITSM